MKQIRRTIKYVIGIVVVVGLLVGGIGYYVWQVHRGQIIQDKIEKEFAKRAPNLKLRIGKCRFDNLRRVTIDDIQVSIRGESRPLTTLPHMVVTIDKDRLIDDQQLVIKKVLLTKPHLELTRTADRKWSWEKISIFGDSEKKGSLPQNIEIENGTVTLRIQERFNGPFVELTLENIDLKLILSGNKLRVVGTTLVERVGHLKVDGEIDVDQRIGHLNGTLMELKAGRELADMVSSVMPEAGVKIGELRRRLIEELSREPDPRNRSPFSFAGVLSQQAAVAPQNNTLYQRPIQASAEFPIPIQVTPASSLANVVLSDPDHKDALLGVSVVANVFFQVSVWKPLAPPEFKVLVDLQRGKITNPALAFPLHDLTGKLYFDNRQIKIDQVRATNGSTGILVSGRVSHPRHSARDYLDINVTNLKCDQRLRSRLSMGFGRIYDAHHPTGFLDVSATLRPDVNGKWKSHNLLATANRCSVYHDVFPYLVEDVNGTVRQEGSVFLFDMKGFAGRRPISLKGSVRNPGPMSDIVFDIGVQSLPIDQAFLEANRTGVRSAIESMKLTGLMDGHIRIEKPPGTPRFTFKVDAVLHDGSMEFEHFRYRIDNLSGRLTGVQNKWTFRELSGTHGSARLAAAGVYVMRNGVNDLTLRVVTTAAPIDDSLKSALSNELNGLWDDFAPSGTVDVVTDVWWRQGMPAEITLPQIEQYDGRLRLKAFPYAVSDVRASYSYAHDQLTINSFRGKHDDVEIVAKGKAKFETGLWTARLDQIKLKRLAPDRSLLRALRVGDMDGLYELVSSLDPDQTIDINGMLELKGTGDPRDPITAAWDIETVFSGGNVDAGLDLQKVKGRVDSRGIWDGEQVTAIGGIHLDEATVLDYRMENIRGPYQIRDGRLILGSKEMLDPRRRRNQQQRNNVRLPRIDARDRMTADFIGGTVFFDAIVALEEQTRYQASLEFSHGKLEQYAKLWLPDQKNMSGTVNAWMELQGQGPDEKDLLARGQLQISNAAIYESPIIVQMLEALTGAPPAKSAFDSALLDFNIANRQFLFNTIDLRGSPISLYSRGGRAGFDGKLKIDFYSTLPRTRTTIPFITALLNETTTGWIGIEVRGDIDNPKAKVKPAPLLDDAVKLFLKSFELPPTRPQFRRGVLSRQLTPKPRRQPGQ